METKEPQKPQTESPKIEVTVQDADSAPLAKIPGASEPTAEWQQAALSSA